MRLPVDGSGRPDLADLRRLVRAWALAVAASMASQMVIASRAHRLSPRLGEADVGISESLRGAGFTSRPTPDRNCFRAVWVFRCRYGHRRQGERAPSAGGTSSGQASVTPAAAASSSPASEAPALPVLASRKSSAGDIPIQVELNQLRVQGRVTELTFTARSLLPEKSTSGASRSWQIANFFSDGVYQQKQGSQSEDSFSVDGVYLLDPVGAKRYLAARTASGGCVCSGDLVGTFVNEEQAVVLATVFSALPANVNVVNVYVPKLGIFEDVPVTR